MAESRGRPARRSPPHRPLDSARHRPCTNRARRQRSGSVRGDIGTDRDVDGTGERPDADETAHIHIAHELVQRQRAGFERALLGGILGPSDTFNESPIVKAKLLCPYCPLMSYVHFPNTPRTPAVPEASTTVG